MGARISVETRRASELDPQARVLWTQFRDSDPALSSPYFDLRYILAAGAVAPQARVAVIRKGGEIVAFLAFQRRGGVIQPMAAPLTDYHGLVVRPGAEVDLKEVLKHLRVRRFRFGGLVGGQGRPVNAAAPKPAMVANLSGGYDAYLEGRRAAGQGSFLKDKRRRRRLLAEQVGPLSLSLSSDPAILEMIIAEKRAQMRRTGQHDVFSTAWTQDLLRRLNTDNDPGFGLRVAVLRAGDKVVAAEAGLLSGSVYHLWFPIYDPDYARYSPGALMTLETLRVLAEQGVAIADFGPGAEDYKRAFADEGDEVVEGDVTADPFVEGLQSLVRQIVSCSPPLHDGLRAIYQRLDRRLYRIAACEPGLDRQITAAGRSLGRIGRIGRNRTAGAGRFGAKPRPIFDRRHSRSDLTGLTKDRTMTTGTPTDRLIPAWAPKQKVGFRKTPITFAHRLAQTGLFDDAALAALLDRYPAELYDINLFDYDDEGQVTMRTGVRGRLPGEKVLEGIKDGRVWVQLRRVEQHYEALIPLIHDAFQEISREAPGFRPVQLNGQLILSAPQAKVPFHADAPGVCLFHMRGKKRIWIYPVDEAHMPQTGMEDIMLKQQTEDLPYRRDMDAAAQVFDLEPGMAATWPLHAPHRIENQEGFNVSLSVDYQTWGSRITNGAHYANGIFRRKGLPVAAMSRTPMPARAGLWAASLALKRAGLVEDKIANLERSFELDGVKV